MPSCRVVGHRVHRHDRHRDVVGLALVDVDLRVEGLLADGDRERTRVRDREREVVDRILQHLRGDDSVHEAPLERRLGADQLARQQHLERALATHRAGDGHHRRRAEQPDLDARSAEASTLLGNREVARRDELAPGRRGDAVHLRDDRLRDRADRAHQQGAAVEQPAVRRRVTCGRHLAQVVTGRERRPRRGDHHDTGVFVVAHGLQRAGEVGHQLEAHGVALLRAVERDAGDRPVALDKDVVAHVSILGLTFENTTTAPDPHIAPSATPPSESSANWPPL